MFVSYVLLQEKEGDGHVRCKQSHVSTANDRICDSGVESRDSDEHDGVGESRENMLHDDHEQVPGINAIGRKDGDCDLSNNSCNKASHESPAPES